MPGSHASHAIPPTKAFMSAAPLAPTSLPTKPSNVRQSARFWNRTARRYARDSIADPEGYERTLTRVSALLHPFDSVLEIGCGTGSTALRLAPRVSEYVASDVASEMITIAREKLAEQPTRSLRFTVAEAQDRSPEPTARTVDAILAFNLLHLVDDLDATLDWVAKRLKPGGLFASKTACLTELNPLMTRLAIPIARALGKAPPLLVFDAAHLQRAIERHGMRIEAAERHGTRGKDIRLFIAARKIAP
jgi:SAM-dependent methyltransferase